MKKHIAGLLAGALLLANPGHAETPCDFKGMSVRDKTPVRSTTVKNFSTHSSA